MFLMRSKNCNVDKSMEVTRKVVKSFFDYSDELRSSFSQELKMISGSPDVVREVFRHSLCLALNLKSVSAYPELSEICKLYANRLIPEVSSVLDKPEAYRQGVLQAGVHYMMFSTKRNKKELEENYVWK